MHSCSISLFAFLTSSRSAANRCFLLPKSLFCHLLSTGSLWFLVTTGIPFFVLPANFFNFVFKILIPQFFHIATVFFYPSFFGSL